MHTMNSSSTSTVGLVNNSHFRPNTVTVCTESENYPHTPKTSQQTNEQTSSISPKSLDLEGSVDEDCSCIETSKLNRSCPEISPKNREELGELRAKITYLEKKLESAEKEIDRHKENSSLRKQIIAYEKKTVTLANLCRSTPKIDKNKKKQKKGNKTKLDYTLLNQVECGQSFQTTQINKEKTVLNN
ncbi:unnamed protein product [Parnassius apollo]|uniref:(apollo) hypothetical protein n=1 Tax=Parnassius apollo TaxID=110799 RepID=A0A8S3Y9B2_PARAO|nr:unnamed protein product [Parnassius apollo]